MNHQLIPPPWEDQSPHPEFRVDNPVLSYREQSQSQLVMPIITRRNTSRKKVPPDKPYIRAVVVEMDTELRDITRGHHFMSYKIQ